MSRFAPQIKIPATHMRGGTSKGVFFKLQDLPEAAQQPGPARDALLLRVLGSPDPYGKQIDGLGNASSSTSKAVILSKSTRSGHDVDYLFGQVAIDKPFVDWSGNCGNLSAAVGPCAIHMGLIDAARIPQHGSVTVRIWQANIDKTIVAHVPIANGQVQETGDFELDGVTFPAAEVALEFINPAADEDGALARRDRRRQGRAGTLRPYSSTPRQSATPAPNCKPTSTPTPRPLPGWRPSAPTVPCAWA